MVFDLVIRDGSIFDGNGGPSFGGDVAVSDGLICAIGNFDGIGIEEIDASGMIVTPGFVDIHTHYDGQATWDDELAPSSHHGVTTVMMGNCGVGFAPVKPDAASRRELIELMEGVEDIPGTALWEGIQWSWESFPEYLDFLADREFTMDIATLVPHGALRAYVMGERGIRHEAATSDDIEAMSRLAAESIDRGAFGFSTSRILAHQSIGGSPVPGTFAQLDEVLAIGRAVGAAGGLLQLVPGGSVGSGSIDLGMEHLHEADLRTEVDWMARLSREAGMQITFLLVETSGDPDLWRRALDWTEEANANGAMLRPQVGGRPVGAAFCFRGRHMFERRPTYARLASLPFAELLVELKRSDIKASILAEDDLENSSTYIMDRLILGLKRQLADTFPLQTPLNYVPSRENSVSAMAARQGVEPEQLAYDLMLENDGQGMLIMPMQNFVHHNERALHTMLTHKTTVLGLADGGAHCSVTCDGALPTYMLTHWARKSDPDEALPLQRVIQMQTKDTAALAGLSDRGVIEIGKRADINIIDFQKLVLKPPFITYDLPAGGARMLQAAEGYVATIVAGEVVRHHDMDTGKRPGRLVRRNKSAELAAFPILKPKETALY